MATTITLPIKCSTVKIVDTLLNRIVDKEFIIAVCGFIGWSITLNYRFVVAEYSFYPDFEWAAVQIVASWLGLFVMAFLAVVEDVPYRIYSSLPSLACIKDDEVQP